MLSKAKQGAQVTAQQLRVQGQSRNAPIAMNLQSLPNTSLQGQGEGRQNESHIILHLPVSASSAFPGEVYLLCPFTGQEA